MMTRVASMVPSTGKTVSFAPPRRLRRADDPSPAMRAGFDFSRVALFSDRARGPAIGRADDPAEAEADRAADQVMRGVTPQITGNAPSLRRECAACETEDQLHKTADASGWHGAVSAPPIVGEVLQTPGQSLAPATRGFMEQRFGHDFSRVRIHADGAASRSAEAVAARAYTVGSDVVFRRGEYAPEALAGRRLLAHELAHVVQQSKGGAPVPMVQRAPEDEGATGGEATGQASNDQGRQPAQMDGGNPGCANAIPSFFMVNPGPGPLFANGSAVFLTSGGTMTFNNSMVNESYDIQYTGGLFTPSSGTLAPHGGVTFTANTVKASVGGTIIVTQGSNGAKTFTDVVLCP